MKSPFLIGLVGLAATGCYQQYGPGPAYAPMTPEPVSVSGPPGGGMDQDAAYQAPQNPEMPGYPDGYPQGGYPQGYPQGSEYGQTPDAQPQAEPQPANAVMGTVTDGEIDNTLAPYGEWVSDEEYGRIWRPYATVVGVNFTPYETCGSWVYTDYGYTFQACDEYASWGWLPFHYGQWDWFDSGWCWVPDYTWSPGWVDWRTGGDTVGWRPTRPQRTATIRDHRAGDPLVRDHRHGARESDWRFVNKSNLGSHNLHAVTINTAEGLRGTTEVARPPVSVGTRPTITAAAVMKNRNRVAATSSPNRGNPYTPSRGYQPSRGFQQPGYQPNRYQPNTVQPNRGFQNGYQSNRVYPAGTQPQSRTYQPGRAYQPNNTYQPGRAYQPNNTYQPGRTYQQPNSTYQSGRYQGTYQQPSRGSQPTRGYQGGQPARGYQSQPRSYGSSSSSSSSSRPSSSSYSRPSSSGSSSRSSSSSSPSRSSSSSSSSSSRSSSSSSSSRSSSSGGSSRHK